MSLSRAAILILVSTLASALQIETVSGNSVSEGTLTAGNSINTLATAVDASSLTKRLLSGTSRPWNCSERHADWLVHSINPTIGGTQSVSVRGSGIAVTQTLSRASAMSSVLSSSTAMSSSTTLSTITASTSDVVPKKKNLSGTIAGAAVGGLIVIMLAAGGFLLCRAHRHIASSNLLPVSNPLTQSEWPSTQLLNSSGETNSSPPTQAVPRGNRASAEKARLQQEIQDLTGQAEAQGLAHSTPPSATVNPDDANPRLLEETKMLRNQMSALQQQQMQMQAVIDQGLPEYTSSPT
ncbi:hypothetical protein B0H13DRAFT_1868131 [Mycena leptocephala]|nr:hypothetical protein B0H13DRAFT_1868131 [Mycena leptocephala]